jgi:hypothetical protein
MCEVDPVGGRSAGPGSTWVWLRDEALQPRRVNEVGHFDFLVESDAWESDAARYEAVSGVVHESECLYY